MVALFDVNEDAPLKDPGAWRLAREVAGKIAASANRNTSAEAGITYEPKGTGVPAEGRILVGPTGAPAIALEFGTRYQPARRYVKRALDAARQ